MTHLQAGLDRPARSRGMRVGAAEPRPRGGSHRLSAEDREGMVRAGAWLKACRVAAGISQKDMQKRLAIKNPIFFSKVENGHERMPPQYYAEWGRAVGMEPRRVAQTILGFYTPFLYEPLFGEPFKGPAEAPALSPPRRAVIHRPRPQPAPAPRAMMPSASAADL